MSTVKVYDYFTRHVGREELVQGPFMATRETIEAMDGQIVEGSERVIEAALVTDGKVMRDTVVHYGNALF